MLIVDMCVEPKTDEVTLCCLSVSRGSEEGQGLPGVSRGLCPGAQEPCWYVNTHIYCLS